MSISPDQTSPSGATIPPEDPEELPCSQPQAEEAAPSTSDPAVSLAPDAFINEGYESWTRGRLEWLPPGAPKPKPKRRVVVDYDVLVSGYVLPKRVPLKDAVDCLVEWWEQEDYDD